MNFIKYVLVLLFSVNCLHGAANTNGTPKAQGSARKSHAQKVADAKAKLAAATGMITVNFLNPENGSSLGSQEFQANAKLTTINETARNLAKADKVRLEVSTLSPQNATSSLERTFGFRRIDKFHFLSQIPHREGEPSARHILVQTVQPSTNQLTTVAETASQAPATIVDAATTTPSNSAPSQVSVACAAAAACATTTVTASSAAAKKSNSLLHNFLKKTKSISNNKEAAPVKKQTLS